MEPLQRQAVEPSNVGRRAVKCQPVEPLHQAINCQAVEPSSRQLLSL
jgi:hypothetical protein